ncbi:hypothetical protein AGMMS49957_08040 [Synergistales bacterium]|nr:hypothetical protein AGMMS49957_08040 [Synergistales bacterium]
MGRAGPSVGVRAVNPRTPFVTVIAAIIMIPIIGAWAMNVAAVAVAMVMILEYII